MIELDVRVSRDGVPVLIHNSTVDDADDMRRLARMGVDAIYTNWPERLLKIMGRRKGGSVHAL